MTGEMAILDTTGHTRLMWDSNSPDEIENARRTFNDLRSKGYIAYSVKERGDAGEVLREFDAAEGKIILSPAMKGG